MKKQLSMFLVLALLTVLYGGAFADTLQLPGSLTTIEAESFSDNPALDEVSVAWGTERIESRAFASSGVKKIYIPATVTAIADDAFAGTSVTICSAADAYARQYADAHGLAWEDSGSKDTWAIAETFAELRTFSTDGENAHVDALQPLSGEGVTDPELLAAIARYNDGLPEVNAALADYNQSIDALGELVRDSADLTDGVQVSETKDGATLTMDGMCLEADGALDEFYGADFTEITSLGGGVFRVDTSAGTPVYMSVSMKGVRLSRRPVTAAVNGFAESNGALDDAWNRAMGWIDRIYDFYDNICEWFGSVEAELDLAILRIDAARAKVWAEIDPILKMPRGQEMTDVDWGILEYGQKVLQNQQRRKDRLLLAKSALKRFSAAGNFANLLVIRKHMEEMGEITEHGHPTKNDVSELSRDAVERMNQQIEDLLWLYVCDGLSSILGLATDAASWVCGIGAVATVAAPPSAAVLGAAAVALRVANIANGLIGTFIFGVKENELYNSVMELHKQLHTHVYGWVKDKDTGLTLEDVEVSDGLNKTRTDNFGYYELYIIPNSAMPERVTLIFEKETPGSREKRILKGTEEVELVLNEGVQCDAELEEIVPIDEEHFPDEKFREAVARRDTDANGLLTSSEREGGNLWVTGASNLEGIEYFPELEDLRLYSGAVSRLDLHDFANLKYLDCSYGQLSYLDVSGCTSLETLNCRDNQIFYLNINGATNIVTIIFDNNAPLSGVLDLSACHRLTIYKEDYRSEYYYVYDSGSERWVRTYWAFGTNLSRVYISRQSPAYAPIYEDIAPELTQDRYWGIIRIVD